MVIGKVFPVGYGFSKPAADIPVLFLSFAVAGLAVVFAVAGLAVVFAVAGLAVVFAVAGLAVVFANYLTCIESDSNLHEGYWINPTG